MAKHVLISTPKGDMGIEDRQVLGKLKRQALLKPQVEVGSIKDTRDRILPAVKSLDYLMQSCFVVPRGGPRAQQMVVSIKLVFRIISEVHRSGARDPSAQHGG